MKLPYVSKQARELGLEREGKCSSPLFHIKPKNQATNRSGIFRSENAKESTKLAQGLAHCLSRAKLYCEVKFFGGSTPRLLQGR